MLNIRPASLLGMGVVLLAACQAPAPDFSVSVPGELVAVQNRPAALEVKIERRNNFDQPVTLGLEGGNGARLPEGIRAASVALGNAGSLSITVDSSLSVATYALQVRATGGGLNKTAPFRLVIREAPDFDLTASNTGLSAAQGGSASTSLSIRPNATFNGSVALSLEQADGAALPGGLQASFSPLQNGTSTLDLTTSGTLAAAAYALQIRATGDGVSKTLPLTLNVTRLPDFNVGLASPSLSLIRGNSASTGVSLERLNGFAAPVGLSLLRRDGNSLPTGIAAQFTPGSVSGGGSTLEVSISASVAAQTYPLMVRAVSGSTVKTADLDLVVEPQPALSIGLDNPSASVPPGASFSRTVSLRRTNLGGGVSLVLEGSDGSALPSGVSASFSPSLVGGDSSTLSVSVANNAAPQTLSLRVRATAGGLSATTPLTLTVQSLPSQTVTVRNTINGSPANGVWAAYQNGNGAWQVLSGSNGVYSFSVRDPGGRYSFAVVCAETGSSSPGYGYSSTQVALYHLTTADGLNLRNPCGYPYPPSGPSNTVSGNVIGLDADNDAAAISFVGNNSNPSTTVSYRAGGSVAAYQMSYGLINGSYDINSTRFDSPAAGSNYRVANRMLLEPNIAINGNLARDIDFTSPNAFDLVGSYTVSTSGPTPGGSLGVGYLRSTGNGVGFTALTQFQHSSPPSTATSFPYRSVPSNRRAAGDAYYVGIGDSSFNQTTGINTSRSYARGFANPANLTLALPPVVETTRQMTGGNGLLLPAMGWNTPNVKIQRISYRQSVYRYDPQANTGFSSNLTWAVVVSNTWLAGGQTHTLPDLSSLSGWQTDWSLSASQPTNWQVEQMDVNLPLLDWLNLMQTPGPPANFDWANFFYSTSSQYGLHNPPSLTATSSRQNAPSVPAQPANVPAWLPEFGR